MDYISANDERFFGKSDNETIQNAINYAKEQGVCEVVIPRINKRTNTDVWTIEKVILLPSDMTVIINNAHLRMADGVFENMFKNENHGTELGKTLEGEQDNIRLIGIGHAVLDGGKLNGLTEQIHRDNPETTPPMFVNLTVNFSNVRNFEIKGLEFVNTRWWAICLHFCRFGKISDLNFRNHATMENQDGIDLRCGCEYITIENITGITGDDTIAFTALPCSGHVNMLKVEEKTVDIHDITVHNVISSSHGCGVVRFLCEDGAKEYNITIDKIKDTGRSITAATFIMGSANTRFVSDHPRRMGDFKNITITNVTSCAQRVFTISEPCENLIIENVASYGTTENVFQFSDNFIAKNVLIKNVYFDSDPEYADAIITAREGLKTENLGDITFKHFRSNASKYLFRVIKPEIEDFKYEKPSIAEFTDEKHKTYSAYGRYFKNFYGKEIQNRPKDNRFDGTVKEDNY